MHEVRQEGVARCRHGVLLMLMLMLMLMLLLGGCVEEVGAAQRNAAPRSSACHCEEIMEERGIMRLRTTEKG